MTLGATDEQFSSSFSKFVAEGNVGESPKEYSCTLLGILVWISLIAPVIAKIKVYAMFSYFLLGVLTLNN